MKIQSSNKFKKLSLKGFSLVETLITLIVVGIIIIMLTNVLSIALKVSVLSTERAHVKNEMSNLLQKLDRDVSNAEYIFIPESVAGNPNEILVIETSDYRVRWTRCDNDNPVFTAGEGTSGSLCQFYCAIDPNVELSADTCPIGSKLNFISSRKLLIENFLVEEITSSSNPGFVNQRIKSAVVTVKARHSSESLRINNLYKQITISSNNFII